MYNTLCYPALESGNCTYLAYRGEVYQQVYGTAMGSPVSVTEANLVKENVEQRALNTCASPPAFWKRYVDDTFTVLPKGQVQQFHAHLNSIEPTIKFTVEMEQEGSLPFLDTRVIRNSDGSLTTTVFRKKTHSDWYLVFDSHHPLAHKVAVTRTLLTQADWICARVPDTDVEKRRITVALSSNGYPTTLVKKSWHPTPHSTPPLELDTPKAVVVIPYVKHLSESIRRILSPLKICTCFRPHRTLRQALVNLKDRVPL